MPTGRIAAVQPPESKKIANFWRSEVAPGNLDEVLSILEAFSSRALSDEPGTEIQGYHLEAPNVIWVYAMFTDADALRRHREIFTADPRYYRLKELFTHFEKTHETTPLFVKGIDVD